MSTENEVKLTREQIETLISVSASGYMSRDLALDCICRNEISLPAAKRIAAWNWWGEQIKNPHLEKLKYSRTMCLDAFLAGIEYGAQNTWRHI